MVLIAHQLQGLENNIQDNYARPVINTAWRGSFTGIGANYDSPGRIFAHLSSHACVKVVQEADMMPSLLHLEMHPKTFLWPKSFQERGPSGDDIALYFFRGDPINEKIFDHLVQDMMDKELAMIAPTKNAELLIFTSMVLPHRFQRFRGKYYLWGVFRNKRVQRALLKRVDVAVQSFVEPVDNPMGQPAPCKGSEHIPNGTDTYLENLKVELPFVNAENAKLSDEVDNLMKMLHLEDSIRLQSNLKVLSSSLEFIQSQEDLETKKADARLECSSTVERQPDSDGAHGDCKFKNLELSSLIEKKQDILKTLENLEHTFRRLSIEYEDGDEMLVTHMVDEIDAFNKEVTIFKRVKLQS